MSPSLASERGGELQMFVTLYYITMAVLSLFLFAVAVYDTMKTEQNYTDEDYRPYDWELDGE